VHCSLSCARANQSNKVSGHRRTRKRGDSRTKLGVPQSFPQAHAGGLGHDSFVGLDNVDCGASLAQLTRNHIPRHPSAGNVLIDTSLVPALLRERGVTATIGGSFNDDDHPLPVGLRSIVGHR